VTTLSNSSFTAFQKCPAYYQEKYLRGLSYPDKPAYFQFGERFHQMLQAHYLSTTGAGVGVIPPAPNLDPQLELEAQAMLAAYKAHYPREDFEVVEVERYFEVPIGNHTHIGRIDMVIRDKATKRLSIFETKTERKGSKRNSPEAWAARTQATLYLRAGSQIYGQAIHSVILNVCTRGSEKGRVGPTFRRDILERTDSQVQQAEKDFEWVAQEIEDLESYPSVGMTPNFPRNTNACISEFGQKCEFYGLHTFGDSPESRSQFVEIQPYGYLDI
jgi:hypothetical protein